VRLLAPRDHLAVVALHAAISNRHALAALRGLLDIALVADAIDDWDVALQDYRDWRIARVMAHALGLAGDLFRRPVLLDASQQLQRGRSARLLFRHVDTRRVLDAGRSPGGLARWSFLVCAVDRIHDALRLCGRALWPSRAWMQARYADAGLGRRLLHLANAARANFD
jgi:hypothetical protein